MLEVDIGFATFACCINWANYFSSSSLTGALSYKMPKSMHAIVTLIPRPSWQKAQWQKISIIRQENTQNFQLSVFLGTKPIQVNPLTFKNHFSAFFTPEFFPNFHVALPYKNMIGRDFVLDHSLQLVALPGTDNKFHRLMFPGQCPFGSSQP